MPSALVLAAALSVFVPKFAACVSHFPLQSMDVSACVIGSVMVKFCETPVAPKNGRKPSVAPSARVHETPMVEAGGATCSELGMIRLSIERRRCWLMPL